MEEIIKLLLIIVLSYLSGALPTAVIVSKVFFGFDIRQKGSGNMGSTNAFRILGWKWGVVVQIVDVLKGVIPVVVIAELLGKGISLGGFTYFQDITVIKIIAGLSAVFGHIWSVFVGFKGGKGISTTAGMMLAIAPVDVAIGLGIFFIALIFSGYVSLGSLLGSIAIPSSMAIRYNIFNIEVPGYHILIFFLLALCALLIFTHRQNIVRLAKGTENKFSKLQLIKLNKKRSE